MAGKTWVGAPDGGWPSFLQQKTASATMDAVMNAPTFMEACGLLGMSFVPYPATPSPADDLATARAKIIAYLGVNRWKYTPQEIDTAAKLMVYKSKAAGIQGVTEEQKTTMEDLAKTLSVKLAFPVENLALGFFELAQAGYNANQQIDVCPMSGLFGVDVADKAPVKWGSVKFDTDKIVSDAYADIANMMQEQSKQTKEPVMPWRRFEFTEGYSSKFWEIQVDYRQINKRRGKIGTDGQSQTKSYLTGEDAEIQADFEINGKIAKGYVEVTPGKAKQPAKVAPQKPATQASKFVHGLHEIAGMVLVPADCITGYSLNHNVYGGSMKGEINFVMPPDYTARVAAVGVEINQAAKKTHGAAAKPAVSRIFTLDED